MMEHWWNDIDRWESIGEEVVQSATLSKTNQRDSDLGLNWRIHGTEFLKKKLIVTQLVEYFSSCVEPDCSLKCVYS
jgi:hypothetical protein